MTPETLVYPSLCGISTPCFIPSVSGAAKSNLTVQGHIRALVEWGAPRFLVSAYDIDKLETADRAVILGSLEQALDNGSVVFLDSGGYEARWLRDPTWSIDAYHRLLLTTPHSVAFTYDIHDTSPVLALEVTAERLGTASGLIPIVHGTGAVAEEAVAQLNDFPVAAVAVTERDLGAGVDSVARAIRGIVDASRDTVPIHVLGAGNPRSILAYAAAGAASFDGLDWCQTVADPQTGTMHHSNHLPFFSNARSPEDGDYALLLLSHNLLFFDEWMSCIREAIRRDGLASLMATYLPRGGGV